MWKRSILNEEQTKTVATALQAVSVDLIDMALLAKQAHWNLRGPNFLAIHEKLDEVTASARNFGDEVAERMVMLGVAADGRSKTVAGSTRLEAYPEGFQSVQQTIALVADRLHTLINGLREARAAVEEADPVTEDMLIEISGEFEKQLWMFQASQKLQ